MSDSAIVKTIGAFVRHYRVEQNKTQNDLAQEAGVNRSTLSDFENGTRVNIITFIQLLRALNLLHVLEQFKIQQQLSPIQLAKMDQAKRKRASKNRIGKKKKKSDW